MVIPAYRVARHVADVVRGIPEFVSLVVVVDDASPDETATIVGGLGDPRVHLVRRERNGGVGAAVISGYETALSLGADVVVKMDGDGQMDPRFLPALVAPILRGEADYTKGSRFVHSHQLERMPWVRRVGNLGLSFLSKAASGYWGVFDPTNGYTAIHRDALVELERNHLDSRWFFETSILIELNLLRAVVRDVPIPALYGEESSSLSTAGALFRFPRKLLAALLRRLWLQYFVRDFSVASLFMVAGGGLSLFGGLWGAGQWIHSAFSGVSASTGTVMLAVVPLILGVQLLLQAITLDIQSGPTTPISQMPSQSDLDG